MDIRLEQIRQNLLAASASANQILPYPPIALKQAINAAWERYYRLVEMRDAAQPRPGKPDFGFLPLVIAGVIGLAALMGGSAYIAKELNESDRLNKLAQCIEEATKNGVPLAKAQQACNDLYGEKRGSALISVGGLDLTTLALFGGLGIGGVYLLGKLLK